jgi:hypothetical protein
VMTAAINMAVNIILFIVLLSVCIVRVCICL